MGNEKLGPDYITGTGQRMFNVHAESAACHEFGCSIHNPTDKTGWPTLWRDDRGLMERLCPCGVGHPDRDHIAWVHRTRGAESAKWEAVHGCCGVCNCEPP